MKKGPDIETETNEKGTRYRDRNSYKINRIKTEDNEKETGYMRP